MKKLLSALLIATLLIASVACVFAVAEEEGNTAVIFNFLDAVEEADTEDATIKFVDGAVEITLKRAVSGDNPLFLVDSYDNAKFDLAKQTYVAIDFKTTGTEADFRAHYTRNNNGEVQTADNYFTGAKNNEANVKSSGDTYVVWDITAYTASRRLEDGHSFLDLAVMNGAEGDVITIYTYALVSDENAMTVGTPLVPKATAGNTDDSSEDDATSSEDDATSSEDDATSSEDDATSSEDDATSSEEAPATSSEAPATSSEAPAASSEAPAASSEEAPKTGDAGMIVFAVLAVVALAGGIIVVRARG